MVTESTDFIGESIVKAAKLVLICPPTFCGAVAGYQLGRNGLKTVRERPRGSIVPLKPSSLLGIVQRCSVSVGAPGDIGPEALRGALETLWVPHSFFCVWPALLVCVGGASLHLPIHWGRVMSAAAQHSSNARTKLGPAPAWADFMESAPMQHLHL